MGSWEAASPSHVDVDLPNLDRSGYLSDMAMEYAGKFAEVRRRWRVQVAVCATVGVMGILAVGWLWSLRHYSERPLPRSSLTMPLRNGGGNNSEWSEAGDRVLIHIGKTGGMTVRTTVKEWIDYEVHVSHKFNWGTRVPAIKIQEFHPKPNDRLIISVRDPVKRVVSAWNFRHYLTRKDIERSDSRCSLCEEKQCFAFFTDINELAEALPYDPLARGLFTDGCIQHLKQNYSHYISPIADFIKQHSKQVEIIRQEHMDQDMERVFHVKYTRETHSGPSGHKDLSEIGQRNLEEFLSQEYKIYYWLLNLKGLEP